MIRNIICILICLVLNLGSLFAQDTYYYKLTKTVDPSKNASTSVSGGQFITFIDNICYESDKKGMGVGHGSLKLNKSYSSSSFSVYMGKSYWGNKASFKFNSDKSVLNVILDDGTVYVYKRSTPPANVTTCSLIKGKTSSGGAPPANNPVPAYTPHPPINNGSGSAPSGTTVQSNSNVGSSSSTQGHNSSGKRDCHLCHGTGQCPSCNGSGVIYSFYGDKLDCPNCTNGKCKNCQ